MATYHCTRLLWSRTTWSHSTGRGYPTRHIIRTLLSPTTIYFYLRIKHFRSSIFILTEFWKIARWVDCFGSQFFSPGGQKLLKRCENSISDEGKNSNKFSFLVLLKERCVFARKNGRSQIIQLGYPLCTFIGSRPSITVCKTGNRLDVTIVAGQLDCSYQTELRTMQWKCS